MDIQNKPLSEITFSEIVEFCQLGIIEGTTLEYKKDFPKDLAKQFVTFSNTTGGLIIIGIGENSETGAPETWEGIDPNTKPIDRVYQIAANVYPFPTFEVTTTDQSNEGKVFLLIRVLEGSSPPYSTNNDPTPWVRTGNISSPIQSANREELLRLTKKNDYAETTRSSSIEFARRTFKLNLFEAEQERKNLRANPDTSQNVYAQPLEVGVNAAVFEISILPFFPNRELFSEGDLLPTHTLLGEAWSNSAFITDPKSIPGGISVFRWANLSGDFENGQIYFNGHSYIAEDVLTTRENGQREVPAYKIGHLINQELSVARTLLSKAGYNGQISIVARLAGGQGANTTPPNDNILWRSNGKLQYAEYNWEWNSDSIALSSDEGLAKLHTQILKRICWDIGLENVSEQTIHRFFGVNRWYGISQS